VSRFVTIAHEGPDNVGASNTDRRLVAALRAGDETAFATLLDTYHAALLRLARSYVSDRAVAEEVVQETWLGVIRGIDRFEGRSSLKTWLFRILTNTAKKRGARERRTVPFSALGGAGDDSDEAAVDPDRFLPEGHLWAGHWAAAPHPWGSAPEERLLAGEARGVIDAAIARLPESQRQVITLRDVEGLSSGEVCDLLELTEGNQRVLLHRARSRVRRSLDDYFEAERDACPARARSGGWGAGQQALALAAKRRDRSRGGLDVVPRHDAPCAHRAKHPHAVREPDRQRTCGE
jgi:RNA polymerase sigma-70 factor, ECF subfamily